MYPLSNYKEVVELEFKTQACLTQRSDLLTTLLRLQILGIERRKRATNVQELGQVPLVPGFLIVKYRQGPHLAFVGYR